MKVDRAVSNVLLFVAGLLAVATLTIIGVVVYSAYTAIWTDPPGGNDWALQAFLSLIFAVAAGGATIVVFIAAADWAE